MFSLMLSISCFKSQMTAAAEAMCRTFIKVIDMAFATKLHAGNVTICTFNAYTLANVATKKHDQL
jgi:hypothetical protein